MLLHLDEIGSLRYRLPHEARKHLGYSPHKFEEYPVSEEEIRRFTDDYPGEVILGNPLEITWVTDYVSVESLIDDLGALVDRLGLGNMIGKPYCILCVYNKGEDGIKLHVPRALDAIGNPSFRVVEDCGAESGITKPVTLPAEDGLPEAVHRKCSVKPERWELRRI